MRSVFVTGASGFVGRRLVDRLAEAGVERAVALVRRPSGASARGSSVAVEELRGDLLDPDGYRVALRGCDAVTHLAAVTGKARPADYARVNVEGTGQLVEACRAEGVGRFLLVSTIAATFRDRAHYHYAESKIRAERLVAASGLHYTIVRPTMVVGPGSPVLAGLARLAGAPLMPVFGNGLVAVQPIGVEDLVGRLLALLRAGRFRGETLEFGGSEVLSLEDLMNRIRRERFGKGPRAVHLPLRPIRAVLALAEPLLGPLLPLTAGQLASFANDGVAAGHPDPIGGPDDLAELAVAPRDVHDDES